MIRDSVKSADRVLTLIELVGFTGREMSHTEIATAMGIPKSSLTQLLKNLLARGWLSYSHERKAYALGPSAIQLSRRTGALTELAEAAPPLLAKLTMETRETSALNMRRGDESEVVCTELSPMRLLSMMRKGDRAPLYATSGGKAILAFQPEADIDAYLRHVQFTPFTEKTLCSASALRAQLADIQSTGIARSLEEFTPGVIGIACPILEPEGGCSAAINVALPVFRHSDETEAVIVEQIKRSILELTQRCGSRR